MNQENDPLEQQISHLKSEIKKSAPLFEGNIKKLIEKNFPDLKDLVNEIDHPTLSSHPDEFELWETTAILKRRKRFPHENDENYLLRTLYEELFSVNQDPGNDNLDLKMGIPGATLGGLISHFLSLNNINGWNVDKIIEKTQKGKISFKKNSLETIKELDWMDQSNLAYMIAECTWPNSWNDILEDMTKKSFLRQMDDKKDIYPKEADSIGFRLLKILSNNPTMIEDIDEELMTILKKANHFHTVDIEKAVFLKYFWSYCSGKLLKDGFFTNINDSNRAEIYLVIKQMLQVRTNPDMGIFFKYVSPSGHINESDPN